MKKPSTDATMEMTQMLESPDKDLKVAIIKKLSKSSYKLVLNTLKNRKYKQRNRKYK